MVLPLGLDTPRTDYGNQTFNPDPDFSVERSFQRPMKDSNNLLPSFQNGRSKGFSIQTPRARLPLMDRRNPAGNTAASRGEFTPLLKSVIKGNHARRFGRESTSFKSPIVAPIPESSILYNGDSSLAEIISTPVPKGVSSSAASTPLAVLPRRDGGGTLVDGGNMMTLREQENVGMTGDVLLSAPSAKFTQVINKIEKENFGLKLKIHFLEDALRKAGPGFGEAALKENTDLKVDKVTMQQELRRYRKTLTATERDLETYQRQLLESQARAKDQRGEDTIDEELQKLRDDVGDLQAELRGKERIIEEKENEMNELKQSAGHGQVNEEEIARYQADIENLKETINSMEGASQAAERERQELTEAAESAEQDAKAAERDIRELRRTADKLEADADRFDDEKQNLEDELAVLQRTVDTRDVQQQSSVANARREAAHEVDRVTSELREREGQIAVLERQLSLARDGKDRERRELEVKMSDVQRQLSSIQESKDREVSSAESSKERLQIRFEEVEGKLRGEAARNDRLIATDGDLSQECADLRKKLRDADIELDSLESEVREKDLELAKHRSQSSDTSELRGQVQQQREDLRTIEHEVDDLRDQVREKEIKIKELSRGQSQTTELQEHNARKETKVKQLEAAVKDLESRIQQKEGEIRELSRGGTQMKELQRRVHEQARTIDLLKDADRESAQLRMRSKEQDSLARRLQTADERVDQLRIELAERDLTIQTLQKANHAIKELRQQVTERDATTRKLEEASSQVERLRLDIADRDARIERLRDADIQLRRARQQIAEHDEYSVPREDEHQQLRTRIMQLREQVDAQELQLDSLEDEKKELRTQIRKLQGQLADARSESDTRQGEIQDGRSQVERLENQLREREQQSAQLYDNGRLLDQERREFESRLDRAATEARDLQLAVRGRDEIVEAIKQKEVSLRSQVQNLTRQLRERMEDRKRITTEQISSLQQKFERSKSEADELRVIVQERDTAIMSRDEKEKTLVAQLAEMEKLLQQRDLDGDTTGIFFTAEERQELQRKLQRSQDQIDELQRAIQERDQLVQSLGQREEHLRKQIKRLREERHARSQPAGAAAAAASQDQQQRGSKLPSRSTAEIEKIQRCHDRAVEHFTKQQHAWETERKALLQMMDYDTNVSIEPRESPEIAELQQEMGAKARQHQRDIRHWTTQLHSLQQQLEREQGFRADLAWEKKYHLLQLEMYEAYNKLDLQILRRAGFEADITMGRKTPKLKIAILTVIAAIRIKRRFETARANARSKKRAPSKRPTKPSSAGRNTRVDRGIIV